MDFATIMALSSFCVTALVNGALFFHQKRSFDTIDQKIKELEDKCGVIDQRGHEMQLEVVRAQTQSDGARDQIAGLLDLRSEFLERLNDYIRKNDFIRDTQILTNQIESVHKKIDWIDDKMDRLREKTNA